MEPTRTAPDAAPPLMHKGVLIRVHLTGDGTLRAIQEAVHRVFVAGPATAQEDGLQVRVRRVRLATWPLSGVFAELHVLGEDAPADDFAARVCHALRKRWVTASAGNGVPSGLRLTHIAEAVDLEDA